VKAVDVPIRYTTFRDVFSKTKSEMRATFGEFAMTVANAKTYPTKESCPLISLCKYGDIPSPKGYLRHAGNVEKVYGIEADYDGGKVSAQEAASLLAAAGIGGIIVTTASHKPEKPRWRFIAPLSKGYDPDQRREFVGRVNRVVRGIISSESFTLSQSFYIGRVRGAPFESIRVPGGALDLVDGIEPLYPLNGSSGHSFDKTTDAELREAFNRGEGRHDAMLKLSSRWAARGLTADDIDANFEVLFEDAGFGTKNAAGRDLRDEARRMAKSAVEKFGESRAGTDPADDFAEPSSAESSEWGKPHDFLHEPPVPAFTTRDVPECVGEYATRWGEAAGFDPTGVIASCVVTAAATLHDSIRLVVQPSTDWKESARLWCALIGAPGIAKTPAIRAGVMPLQELHKELIETYTASVMLLEVDGEDEKKRPPRPALYTNDCTIEKLSEILSVNPGGILFLTEELDSWLGSHDAYRSGSGSRDRGEWMTLFDGGSHQVDRITRGSFYVSNWGVSLLSATTWGAIERLSKKLPNDGLLQRILPLIIATPSAPDPAIEVKPASDRYNTVIRTIHKFAVTDFMDVSLDSSARALFESEIARYRELAPSCALVHEGWAGHVAKYGAFLARVALTFHAVECAQGKQQHPAGISVRVETVKTAARFMRKCFKHARGFYGQMSGRNTVLSIARRIGLALIADKASAIARRDLIQRYDSFRDATEDARQDVMQLLVDFGWARVVKGRYDKGYPTRWEINPAIHEQFQAEGEEWLRLRAQVKNAITGKRVDEVDGGGNLL
jgi:Protein of unknown function (DUF3987)